MKTKKTLKFTQIIMMVLLVFSICIPSAMAGDVCEHIDTHWIRGHAPIPKVKILKKTPVNGLCQVLLGMNSEVVPIFAGENFVIAGEMFSERVQITKAEIDKIKAGRLKKAMGEIEDHVSFTYTPKNPTGKTVYMVTDPLCKYCNLAGDQMQALADKHGTTVKGIVVAMLGPPSKKKAVESICENYDMLQYVSHDWKKEAVSGSGECLEGDLKVNKATEFAAKAGVRGVPAFLMESGQMISGANMKALENAFKTVKTSNAAPQVKKPAKKS